VTKFLINGSKAKFDNKLFFLLASHNGKEMGYQVNPLGFKTTSLLKSLFTTFVILTKKWPKQNYTNYIVGKINDMNQDKLKTYANFFKFNKNILISEQ
tara:strand:+ start:776 stop:1069 length:294 start_codon:yes stop_codon:yes gene_type:complete